MTFPIFRFRLAHKTLLMAAGIVWAVAGIMLLTKGLRFLEGLLTNPHNAPLLSFYSTCCNDHGTAVALLAATALGLGMIKARFILRKVAAKGHIRLKAFPDPAPFTALFGVRFLFLICGAMIMGYTVNHAGLPLDIRGVIDVAVGGALLNSAMVYLRGE